MDIIELFDRARTHLRYPKLVIPLDTEHNIAFSIISRPKGEDYLWVSNGKKRGDPTGKLFGKVTRNPSFKPLRVHCPPEFAEHIVAICKDPVSTAKVKGQEYSHCCFCGLTLTNKISLAMGYGPICADKWGLPWESEL